MQRMARKVWDHACRFGVRSTARRGLRRAAELLGAYDRAWARLSADPEELASQRAHQPPAGRLSLVIPVYNTSTQLLLALARSILAQTYAEWEACFFDGSDRAETRRILSEIAEMDARFRVSFGEKNEGLSGNTNRAIEMTRGEWVVFCDHDDLLTPDALWQVAACIARDKPDVVYTDEDKVNQRGTHFFEPHPKPDFCPDNLRSGNYVCHMTAVRKCLLLEIGGLDPAFDGSQDHDLMLRLSERTSRIAHVPRVCYHWRSVGSSMSRNRLDVCLDASARAVEAHARRIGWPCRAAYEGGVMRLRYEIQGMPLVSVLAQTMPALDWPNLEHVPLDISSGAVRGVNRAAAQAKGEVLLVLMPGAEPAGKEMLREMLMYAQRPDAGFVFPALADGRGRLRCAGYAVRQGRLIPRSAREHVRDGGWHNMAAQSHNVSAGALACLMIRRDHFQAMDETYGGSAGAADACLRAMERGLRHVYTPHALVRCRDDRWVRIDAADERRFMQAWKSFDDPCYPQSCRDGRGDYSIKTKRKGK